MKEDLTLKDYVIGVIATTLALIPEGFKILMSMAYLWITYLMFRADNSNLDKTQAIGVLLIVMLGPYLAYHFYEKSILKDTYRWVVEYLASKTSMFTIITSEKLSKEEKQ